MRRGFPARGISLLLVLGGFLGVLTTPAPSAERESPLLTRCRELGARFTEMRDNGAKRLTAAELAAASDQLLGELRGLVAEASSDAGVKAEGQKLLSYAYEFAGREAESRSTYSAYLDTLEGARGRDYAVMTVRRAGDRMLRGKDPARAIVYYDLLAEKYPTHVSKAEALYSSGLAAIELGAYGEAAERFDAAVTAAPQGYWAPWALRKKAHALFLSRLGEGDVSGVLQVLEELGKRYPTPQWCAYVQYRKGYVLASAGRYAEALAEYTKGLSDYPSSPYSNMGRRHVKLIREQMEKELLLVKKQQERKEAEEAAQTKEPAGVKTSAGAAAPPGPVSMLFGRDEDPSGGEGGQ